MYQTGKKLDYLNLTAQIDEGDYEKGISMLEETCENMQKENERLVYRLHEIKKLSKRREKDVSLVKQRLDVYNDDWRIAQPEPLLKLENVNYQGFLAHSTEFLAPPQIIPTKKYSRKMAKKNAAGAKIKQAQKILPIKQMKKPPVPGKKRIKLKIVSVKFPEIPKQKTNQIFFSPRKKIPEHQNVQQIHFFNFVKIDGQPSWKS